MNERERNDVVERLKAYQTEIRHIFDLVAKLPLSQQDRIRAQAELKSLKERLKEDYHRGSTVGGRAALNAVERAYFQPAIHEASTTIRVKWNSTPSPTWSSELYSALVGIEHALNELERQP